MGLIHRFDDGFSHVYSQSRVSVLPRSRRCQIGEGFVSRGGLSNWDLSPDPSPAHRSSPDPSVVRSGPVLLVGGFVQLGTHPPNWDSCFLESRASLLSRSWRCQIGAGFFSQRFCPIGTHFFEVPEYRSSPDPGGVRSGQGFMSCGFCLIGTHPPI